MLKQGVMEDIQGKELAMTLMAELHGNPFSELLKGFKIKEKQQKHKIDEHLQC